MSDDTISFGPHDDARDAVKTFERAWICFAGR